MSDGTVITIEGGTTKIVIGGGQASITTDGKVVFSCPSQPVVTSTLTQVPTPEVSDLDTSWQASEECWASSGC